jgi:hypothetical protein
MGNGNMGATPESCGTSREKWRRQVVAKVVLDPVIELNAEDPKIVCKSYGFNSEKLLP